MAVYVCDGHKNARYGYDQKVKTKGAQYNIKYILLTAYVGLGVGNGVVGASDGSSSERCALHSL